MQTKQLAFPYESSRFTILEMMDLPTASNNENASVHQNDVTSKPDIMASAM